ncbi:DUF3426 domain-containing protein [Marinobacter similis]|uniref:Zinc finger/thioredoxin putative domain-containing protein n=1 Tax=Marinobacter similis TaxID=1420916 RepID=W5YLB3_9GAMM|nr:DUF3426 domain-containing protein [Marinobacter similis]AHI29830.1 hypothetical protein AU14_18585 [Marinobacter similis]
MTSSSLQTQCPKCETRFRVTDEQLGIAKGKVRCGNCLSVFNAIEHQVMPRSSSKPAPVQTEPEASGDYRAPEEDFVFADNPEEDASEEPYAGTKLTFSDDELSDSFRTMDGQSGTNFQDAVDDGTTKDVDESWAEAILQETAKPASNPAPEPSPSEKAQASEPEPDDSYKTVEPTFDPSFDPDITPDFELEAEAEPAQTAPQVEQADDFYEPFGNDKEFDFDAEDDQLGEPMAATLPYDNLRREPVSVRGENSGKLRTVIWSVAVLSLIGILVAQVTWFQFDRLSAIPELRPFYEKGCAIAGCELKPLINVDAIQSRKLVVRTDPDNRSQLVVNAVIINRADFEQPFPAIALTFSNLNGDVVAQSIFTPDEYLAGEGQNLSAMPKDTPVRIAIDIRDPGKDAVNYNLNFRPYTP